MQKKIEKNSHILKDHNDFISNSKRSCIWRLNNHLLNDQWVIEKGESNNNRKNISESRDTVKAILKRKFMSVYIKQIREIANLKNLMMHLKVLEKQKEDKFKINRSK
jgi:hypothetical protein